MNDKQLIRALRARLRMCRKDFQMLKSGEWNPAGEGVEATQDSIDAIDTTLKLKAEGGGVGLLRALREVKAWNAADIRGHEEITPSMEMLVARRLVVNKAIKAAV